MSAELTAAVARLRVFVDHWNDASGSVELRTDDIRLVLAALEDAFDAGYAAGYRAAQAAMPPREPTQAMDDAASNVDRSNLPGMFRREVWRTMYDAWAQDKTTTNFLCDAGGQRLTGPLDHYDPPADDAAVSGAFGDTGLQPVAPPTPPPDGSLFQSAATLSPQTPSVGTGAAQAVTDGPAADPINPRLREQLSKVDWRALIEKHGDPPSCPHGVMAGPCAACNPPIADPIADLCERLRDMSSRPKRGDYGICDYWNACDEAADALERLARERDEARAVLQSANRDAAKLAHLVDKYKWQVRDTCTRAERAEAERDALREVVRAADAMRAGADCPRCDYGKLRNPAKEHWESCGFGQYDRARAAWKGET